MESSFETNEVEGVGGVRARSGTSTAELAGAASYWHKQWLASKRANLNKWRDGFLTGVVSLATLSVIVGAVLHLIY